MKDEKEYMRKYYQAHKEEQRARMRKYYQDHKEQQLARMKKYYAAHKEQRRAYSNSYTKADVNSLGKTKRSIRCKSCRYLNKYGTKIPGYEIHHCCTYAEPYKFIYCTKEMHLLIHAYLRQHNIPADSDHYDQIKHILDDDVVLYGLER